VFKGYVAAGGNVIHTADVYSSGRREELLGVASLPNEVYAIRCRRGSKAAFAEAQGDSHGRQRREALACPVLEGAGTHRRHLLRADGADSCHASRAVRVTILISA